MFVRWVGLHPGRKRKSSELNGEVFPPVVCLFVPPLHKPLGCRVSRIRIPNGLVALALFLFLARTHCVLHQYISFKILFKMTLVIFSLIVFVVTILLPTVICCIRFRLCWARVPITTTNKLTNILHKVLRTLLCHMHNRSGFHSCMSLSCSHLF